MNLIDHIGNQVTVWTKEGNSLSARTLITADEMGIVVNPWVGAKNQNKEVFIPWCNVKYVDLIKPSASMIEPIKPPSPEFIAKAKEIIDALEGKCDGGELKKESDSPRAKVGDVVRYCDGIKRVEPLLSQRNEEYTVRRVDDYRIHVDWPADVSGLDHANQYMIIPHGWYTIVRRADEDDTSVEHDDDKELTEAKEIIEAKESEILKRDVNDEITESEVEKIFEAKINEAISRHVIEIPTSKLVEMLEKREGVEVHTVGVNAIWKLVIDYSLKRDTVNGHGPARILIVQD